MSGKRWTNHDIELLKELYSSYDGCIADEFNNRADVRRSRACIANKAKHLGIQLYHYYILTEKEKDWIASKESDSYSIRLIWEEFSLYSRKVISADSLSRPWNNPFERFD